MAPEHSPVSLQEQLGLLWTDSTPQPSVVATPASPSPKPTEFRHPQAEREVRLGDVTVAYACQRAKRRSIGMIVSAEGLSVRAPRWVSFGDIETALQARARWICTKLIEQRERAQLQKAASIEWRDGGTLRFLGAQLTLLLHPERKGHTVVEHGQEQGRSLVLGLPRETDTAALGLAVQAWMKKQARHYYEARVRHFAALMGVDVTRVALSSARTRWGSASVDGSVRLHWRLMHFEPSVIDYVVVHELAHLREMNHSPRFWAVVREAMPDFEAAREALRQAVLPDWT